MAHDAPGNRHVVQVLQRVAESQREVEHLFVLVSAFELGRLYWRRVRATRASKGTG